MVRGECRVLVTGAAGGRVGGVGRLVAECLLRRSCESSSSSSSLAVEQSPGQSQVLTVRAFVREDDARAAELRSLGAEVFVGDLTSASDVSRALAGCQRAYFGMSVSPQYLEATAVFAAVCKALDPPLDLLVNMSQLSVSSISLGQTTGSPQHQQHWLAEHVLDWAGLPVVHVRPTVFLENPLFCAFAAAALVRSPGHLALPFGPAVRSSPIAARDVAAAVVALITTDTPADVVAHHVYELTGAESQDMATIAHEYAEGLGRPVQLRTVGYDEWYRDCILANQIEPHLAGHLTTMVTMHNNGEYDRHTDELEKLLGRKPTTVAQFVAQRRALFLL